MKIDNNKQFNINISIPVTFLKEGAYFVAYTPAFELSSYGKTLEKAKKNFEAAVQIFLEETIEKGTLQEELLALGWEIDKKNKILNPPVVIQHSLTNVLIPNVVYAQ